jgi:hypothetical protein
MLKKMPVIFITSLFILISVSKLKSAEGDVTPVVLPIIAYSSDTNVMLGAIALLTIEGESEAVPEDSVSIVGIYTLKNQIITNAGYKKHFNKGALYNSGSIGYVNFPNSFYGIGANTSDTNEEIIKPVSFPFTQALMINAYENIYLGPTYAIRYTKIEEIEQGGTLDQSDVPGKKESLVSRPGIRFIYDTRDLENYPSEGNYFESNIQANTKILGATQESQSLDLDYRHFFNLYQKKYILGFQGEFVYQNGDVPLVLMESVGGGSLLRGYDEGRYREKSRYGLQTEFRHPYPFENIDIARNFSGVVFAGIGNVAETPADFDMDYTRFAYGAGIRYMVAEESKTNLRVDFTMNADLNFNFYINVLEAF